jgi:hypothetical protein
MRAHRSRSVSLPPLPVARLRGEGGTGGRHARRRGAIVPAPVVRGTNLSEGNEPYFSVARTVAMLAVGSIVDHLNYPLGMPEPEVLQTFGPGTTSMATGLVLSYLTGLAYAVVDPDRGTVRRSPISASLAREWQLRLSAAMVAGGGTALFRAWQDDHAGHGLAWGVLSAMILLGVRDREPGRGISFRMGTW